MNIWTSLSRSTLPVAALRYALLLDRFVGGEGGEIDEIRDGGTHFDDLRRPLEPHQQRTHARSAAELLQELRRDVGAVEAGHDQDIGRTGEPAKGIALAHQRQVERNLRAHLAVILEIDLPRIEELDRLMRAPARLAGRIAEGRI